MMRLVADLRQAVVTWSARQPGLHVGRTGGLIVLVVVLALQAWTYGYHEILFKRPQGYHAWRQSDCLSMTWHYMHDDLPFWEGKMHYLGPDGSGRALSELPILPYIIGKVWRTTGQQEWLYRAFVMLLSFSGLICLFLTAFTLLKDGILAAWVSAFLFTSPMVAYYANNFLPNAAALGFVLIGWHATASGIHKADRARLVLAIALFTVAGLLKATAALSLLILLAILLISFMPWRRILLGPWRPSERVVPLIAGLAAVGVIAAWYTYARSYNSGQTQGIFLIGVLPYWRIPTDELDAVRQGLGDHLRRDYLRPDLYLALLTVSAPALFLPKHMRRALWTTFALLCAGILCIGVLFFGALRDHDYYSLDQVILFPAALLLGLLALVRSRSRIIHAWPFQLLLLAVLVHGTDFARRRMKDRYSTWMNHEYLTQHEPLGRMHEAFRSMGLDESARVISMPDISFNRSLYLMERSGWTDFEALSDHPQLLREKVRQGARYLVTTNDSVLLKPGLGPFLEAPIGGFENVCVFALTGQE
ncbi:MAG: glycosyltransferase family 39 protein [Flavobacteriales bacterium]|nr:glycosyltransferase family 39 protein [Flavobacteriales bacterium]